MRSTAAKSFCAMRYGIASRRRRPCARTRAASSVNTMCGARSARYGASSGVASAAHDLGRIDRVVLRRDRHFVGDRELASACRPRRLASRYTVRCSADSGAIIVLGRRAGRRRRMSSCWPGDRARIRNPGADRFAGGHRIGVRPSSDCVTRTVAARRCCVPLASAASRTARWCALGDSIGPSDERRLASRARAALRRSGGTGWTASG